MTNCIVVFDLDHKSPPIDHVVFVIAESRVAIGAGTPPIRFNLLKWSILIVFLRARYHVIGIAEAKVFGFDIFSAHWTLAVAVVLKAVKNPGIPVTPLNNNIASTVSTAGRVRAESLQEKC